MVCVPPRIRHRPESRERRVRLLAAILGPLALGTLACGDRGLGENRPDGPSVDDDAFDATDEHEGPDAPGNTSTSGRAGTDDDDSPDDGSPDDDSPDDGSPTVDLPPAEPTDPCAAHLDIDQDPNQVCGLLHVDFEVNSDALSFGAQCRLAAAAPCIAAAPDPLYLEGTAAVDEGKDGDEESAILLSQARGAAVLEFLVDHGVSSSSMQVIGKGSLEAQQPAWAGDRRVNLRW